MEFYVCEYLLYKIGVPLCYRNKHTKFCQGTEERMFMYLKLVWKMCSFVVVCFSFPFLSKTGSPYVSLTALEFSTQN